MSIKLSSEIETEVIKCFHCGLCRAWCPVFDVKQNESWNTRGRVMLIKALARGELTPTPSVLDRVYSCSLCKACEVSCPSKVGVCNIIQEARASLVRNGQGPLAVHCDIANAIKTSGNIFGQPWNIPENLGAPIARLPERSENLLYMGCVAGLKYSRHVENLMKILLKANLPFTVFKSGEVCCGGFLEMVGLAEEFQEVVAQSTANFIEMGIKKIVTLCPMCYTTFKMHYGRSSLEVIHATELLQQLISKKRIALKKPVKMWVTYQDPCHLGRHSEVYEAPRKILESIPGLKLVEMEKSRDSSYCCGGPIRIPFIKIRTGMCKAISSEATKVDAKAIVTACPTCFHNLNAVTRDQLILDLSELVACSMGLVKKI